MAAAVLGNLPPLLGNAFPPSERGRIRHLPSPDATLAWPRKESQSPITASSLSPFLFLTAITTSTSGGEEDGRNNQWTTSSRSRRRSSSSKVEAAAGDFDGSELEDDGEEEEGLKSWEVEMKRRLADMEEMNELEKRAEELQSRLAEEGDGESEEESEEEKRNRVRRELEKLAKEQAERRETAKLMFDLGQKAYGKGMYGRAIEFLEGALTIIPRSTLFGGEIQIWLAMAYEANNRHKDCIALYQELEKQHPSVSIRRQAAELRYILQAPKLKITKDEMVTIPLIGSSYDRYAGTWSDKYKDGDWIRKATSSQSTSSQDPWGVMLSWEPPTGLEKSRAFWLAVTLSLGLLGVALLQS